MHLIYHPETTRSFRDFGGVKLYQSFHSYYPPAPNRRRLGAIIALDNLNYLPGSAETCTFPYQYTEVFSLVIAGTVISKNNSGSRHILTPHTVQLLSAGAGTEITRYNGSFTEEADLLQIWFTPETQQEETVYQEMISCAKNQFQLLASPDGKKDSMKIRRQLWVNRGTFESGMQQTYHKTIEDNDVYLFVIGGQAIVAGQVISYRDGLNISGREPVDISFEQPTDLLVIELSNQK